MKRLIKTTALLLSTLLLAGGMLGCKQEAPAPQAATPAPAESPAAETPAPAPAPAQTQREVVEQFSLSLIEQKFDLAEALLGEAPKAQIESIGGMEAFMQILAEETGEWLQLEGPVAEAVQQGNMTIFGLTLIAQNGEFNMQVSVGEDLLIGGFAVLPGAVEPEPPLAMPQGFVEEPASVDAGTGFPLEGRAVLPEDMSAPVPAVLLVQGSGPLDYDETIGANRVFAKLARGLAERGIATLRYDKRTYTYPEITRAGDFSVKEEYVEDVLAAMELLRGLPGVDSEKVFLLGHSEGGMLAPMFLAEGADAAGMILLAGTPRKFVDILKDQQEELLAYYASIGQQAQIDSYRELQKGWAAEVEAWRKMSEEETKSAAPLYGSMGAYYLYVLEQYDSIATIKQLKKPTLILQGGNDRQVYVDKDYAVYQRELADAAYVRMKLYPNLSHAFLPSQADNLMIAQEEYKVQAEIPGEVFDDIAAWIKDVG